MLVCLSKGVENIVRFYLNETCKHVDINNFALTINSCESNNYAINLSVASMHRQWNLLWDTTVWYWVQLTLAHLPVFLVEGSSSATLPLSFAAWSTCSGWLILLIHEHTPGDGHRLNTKLSLRCSILIAYPWLILDCLFCLPRGPAEDSDLKSASQEG